MRLAARDLVVHDRGPFTLSVEKAECLGISGPSGSGKTLLLRALADMDPHEGELLLDGAASESVKGPDWRRQVGLLPSESRWWLETVEEHFEAFSSEWLQELGMDERVLKWKVAQLSSGERQRLALLRMLSRHPKVLLLDEPTANLDSANSQKVEKLVNSYRLGRQAAVVWVSHDEDQLERVSQRRVAFIDGKLEPVPVA